MTPTLETTICANVETCIANCQNETVTDPNIAGANLLACTTQVVNALPQAKKESFICSLLDKANPPPVQKQLEEKLENALNMKFLGSDWCCVVTAVEFKPGKLVSVPWVCRRGIAVIVTPRQVMPTNCRMK